MHTGAESWRDNHDYDSYCLNLTDRRFDVGRLGEPAVTDTNPATIDVEHCHRGCGIIRGHEDRCPTTVPKGTGGLALRRAVAALQEGHLSQVRASSTFGVARKTIGLWLRAYRQGGEAALASRKRGPKGGRGKPKGRQPRSRT